MIFIYRDGRGKITARTVEVISETESNITGLCQRAGSIRSFRTDRILEQFDDIERASQRLPHYADLFPPPKSVTKRSAGSLRDVVFTGFSAERKNELIALATQKGIIIRKNVTQQLDVLCYGARAGPKKLKKARTQKTLVFTEDEYLHFLDTGEIDDEA